MSSAPARSPEIDRRDNQAVDESPARARGLDVLSAGYDAARRPEIREQPPPRVRRTRRLPIGYLLSVLIVLALLLLWQAAIWIGHLEAYILPSPWQVVQAFGQQDTRDLIANNVGVTVVEALTGFGVCIVVGVSLAIAMFTSRIVRDALYPLLIASQAIPTIAIGAVLVIALGYGIAPKIVVVTLYAFFAITVSVYDSLRSLDPELPALLRTLGASPLQVLWTARLPAALPGFFTGAKLAVTYSISGAIYGEWVGSTGGLGYALQMAANQLASAEVLAIVVVMAGLGLAAFVIVAVLERLLVPWSRGPAVR